MMLHHGAISRYVLCFGAVCPARLGGLELRRRRAGLAPRLLVGEDGCRDPADAVRVGDWGDLLEGQLEHIVEDEHQSLSRRQGIEYHKERKTNRVGKQRLLLRLKLPIRADDGVGYVDPEGILAASVARTQHVEAHTGDDSRQPSAQILDLVRT